MSLTKQSTTQTRITTSGEYPQDVPRLSPKILTNPDFAEFQSRFDKWWFDFKTVLKRQQSALTDPVNASLKEFEQFKATISVSLSTATTDIAALKSGLASLTEKESNDVSQINAKITSIEQEIADLQNQINNIVLQNTYYLFTQNSPNKTWMMPNPFVSQGKFPTVTLRDTDRGVIHGEVDYPDLTTVRARFNFDLAGSAILTV